MDSWDLIKEMVSTLHKSLTVPVTCKIRVFDDVNKTIAYAKMIQDAGCQLLTVHGIILLIQGRRREQKGHNTGYFLFKTRYIYSNIRMADWQQIKLVKQALHIPVFANGNILYDEHIGQCLSETLCDGVMTAEGNLYNPTLFSNRFYSAITISQEYLDICKSQVNSASPHAAKSHLFKMLHKILPLHIDVREQLGRASTYELLQDVVDKLRSRDGVC